MEEYRIIPSYPLYKIYSDGRVIRKAHTSIRGFNYAEKELIHTKERNGYETVKLRDRFGNSKMFYVHRLVFQAFNGEIEKGKEIDHSDGCRDNNCLDNLRILNHSQNCRNEKSLERYRIANALDKGKFNREKMMAAKCGKYYDNAKLTYLSLLKRDGEVKIMKLMKEAHIGYYRALKLIREMENEENVGLE